MKISVYSKKLKELGMLFCILAPIACSNSDEPPPPKPIDDTPPKSGIGFWSSGASMMTPRKEISNTVVSNEGLVFTFGGVESSGLISNKVEIYDAGSNLWFEGSELPTPLWRSTAVYYEEKIYVFGGYQSLGPYPFDPSKMMFMYNIANDTWTMSEMPIARGASVAVVLGEKIHLIGGASNSALSRHDIYDPTTDSWEVGPSLNEARSGLTAIEFDEQIFVFGGYELINGQVVSKRSCEVFVNDRWVSIANMPATKLGIDCAYIGESIYVFGGTSTANYSALAYNIVEDRWQELAWMPTPVSFMGVVAVSDSIFVLGGGPQNLNRTDAVGLNRIFKLEE